MKRFKSIIDSLKIIWELDSVVIISVLASSIITAIIPFIGILLSSYIVDGLSLKKDIWELIITSFCVVGGIFVLTVTDSYINKIITVHTEICVLKFDMKSSTKTLTIDYELLDSPKVNDIRSRINSDRNWGAGFYSMIWQ